jgi:hypothetical protein
MGIRISPAEVPGLESRGLPDAVSSPPTLFVSIPLPVYSADPVAVEGRWDGGDEGMGELGCTEVLSAESQSGPERAGRRGAPRG